MVEVKVVGPDYVDLTLVDLPGIVRSTGKHESVTMIPEIDALINAYLKNERCVILAVIPANFNFHNSQIMADAKKVDSLTKRTTPVITKPDSIDLGAEDGVSKLLLGKEIEFALGFHMTKGRCQEALNRQPKQTTEDSLAEKKIFFSTEEPWCSLPDRSIVGTVELRSKLGELQSNIIRDSIPGIVKEVNEKRKRPKRKLDMLGENLATIMENAYSLIDKSQSSKRTLRAH
jgi:hypothetical protein